MHRNSCLAVLSWCVLLSACGDDSAGPDAQPDAQPDAPLSDTSASDVPSTDAESLDVRTADVDISDATDGSVVPSGSHYFPDGSWIYEDISDAPMRPDSGATTAWLVEAGGWGLGRMQIDFSLAVFEVNGGPRVPITRRETFYSPDCDLVPVPVPEGAFIEGEEGLACEGDGDCHFIVADRESQELIEVYRADGDASGLAATCVAVWEMDRVYPAEGRGEQCTSADAAGFPIAPLLFTPEEVASGEIDHAIRFILPNDRMRADLYTRPATHAGGPRAAAPAPVYGSRWRLRADFDLDSLPNDGARVVARAMQRYGMVLADGGNVALTGATDRGRSVSWDGLLGSRDLDTIQPDDFDVIDTGPDIELTYDCVRDALIIE